ncbi:DNA-binding transcriptional regulator, LysR family [Micromonospora viridifaciens]|uniref:DNA-binding transcriptional regulator, LysR family n=1 Tax=Micromonospora viridifaciens TaxID=1881 RepID=A0A1C4YLE5_MICVI|nr:LysR family transcriptional regulator [Micromonospora viridifaciens]SCF21466.1 DNA-binding transcriptional regulator, LysR family [Micromonospora viridifaciens]
METDLLRTFTTVAHTGNFTATARELGYVQSTVTGHVQALERHLGTRLFDRLPSGAVLTDAGTRLLAYATQLLDLEDRLAAEVPAQDDQPYGRVRLMAPESLCAYRLPAALGELRLLAPRLRLSLAPGGTAEALQFVRAGTTEAALLLEPEMSAGDLQLEPLGVEGLTVVAGPDLDLPAGTLTWAQLAEHDVLLLEDGCSYSDQVARSLFAVGQPDFRRVRFGSIEAVKRCVAAGLGWAVLPTAAVDAELRAGALVAVPGPLPTAPTVHLVTHPDRALGVGVKVVLDELRALWSPASPARGG